MNVQRRHRSRRHFLKTAAGTSLAGFTITGCDRKSAPPVTTSIPSPAEPFLAAADIPTGPSHQETGVFVGEGDHRYEVVHHWAKLPDKYTWQTTHNVATDRDGFVYVIHEGRLDQPDHPAIFVFDPEGNFVRGFGQEFQGGGHGLELRDENGEQFLYVTAYLTLKFISKLTLTGEEVWRRKAPMESGIYHPDEPTSTDRKFARDRFQPTNFTFLPDGDFFLADGYGGHCIHRYDSDGNWKSMIGKPGKGDGEFNLPHGLWIDDRAGRDPSLVVADRANNRVQWLTLDGEHLRTDTNFLLPANVDRLGDVLLVPDLNARVSLIDGDDKVINLGEDEEWRASVHAGKLRGNPDSWKDGRFVHPHDACFSPDGSIFVAEWVATGRISKLQKV